MKLPGHSRILRRNSRQRHSRSCRPGFGAQVPEVLFQEPLDKQSRVDRCAGRSPSRPVLPEVTQEPPRLPDPEAFRSRCRHEKRTLLNYGRPQVNRSDSVSAPGNACVGHPPARKHCSNRSRGRSASCTHQNSLLIDIVNTHPEHQDRRYSQHPFQLHARIDPLVWLS